MKKYLKPLLAAAFMAMPAMAWSQSDGSGSEPGGEIPEKPEIEEVHPVPDTENEYSTFTYPELQIYFNMPGDVRFEGAVMRYRTTAGGEATTPLDYREVDTYYAMRYDFYVREALLLVKPEMEASSVFSVIISKPTIDGEPVSGPYINSDGNIELSYYYGGNTGVTEIKYPSPFLSYWAPGNEDGKITVKFDSELAPQEEQKDIRVKIFAGPFVDGGDGWPELPGAGATVEGNTLTVDLTGVTRVPSEQKLKTVTVQITGVVDSNGRQIDYENGNLISIWNIPLKIIELAQLYYEFTPAQGTSLLDKESVELWLGASAFEHVRVDGFCYSVGGETVDLGLDEVEVRDDFLDPGSMIYTIPVPESVREAYGAVYLSAVLTSLDAFDYAVSGYYFNDPEQSGVEGVEASAADAPAYTLQGVKATAGNARGIVIKDGKKVLWR